MTAKHDGCQKCLDCTEKGFKYPSDPLNPKISDYITIHDILTQTPILDFTDFKKIQCLQVIAEKIIDFISTSDKNTIIPLFTLDYYLPSEQNKFTSIYVVDEITETYESYSNKLNKLYEHAANENSIKNKILDTNKILYLLKDKQKKLKPILYNYSEREYCTECFNDVLFINFEKLKNDSKIKLFENADQLVNELTTFYNNNNGTIQFENYFDKELISLLKENGTSAEIYGIKFENIKKAFITYLSFFNSIFPHEIDNNGIKKIAEYIYFPATSSYFKQVKDGKKELVNDWIGGLLLGFYEPTTQAFRNALRHFTQHVVSLVYHQYQILRVEHEKELVQLYATRATVARILNRNYNHHIGAHVSWRSTFDEIYLRVTGKQLKDTDATINNGKALVRSIVEMVNKLSRYKDERNDFIAGIDDNVYPVTAKFYQDIILPFIENSLLMDNLAKSENVCWETENNKVKCNGNSKLRIRVFYKKNNNLKVNECNSREVKIPPAHSKCSCPAQVSNGGSSDVLTMQDLGIDDNWIEILAFYKKINFYACNGVTAKDDEICTHKLPYLKYITSSLDTIFYNTRELSIDDIEISMPGQLGAHSIYSLLENLIRNIAKHADKKVLAEAQNLDIVIKIKEPDEESIKYDFYDIEFTTNIPSIKDEEHLKILQAKLKEKLNEGCKSLGFADMRINATLLRFDEITQKNLDKSISLQKYPHSKLSNSYALSVNLKLSKPHKIILIGDQFMTYDSPDNKIQGIWCFKNINDCIKSLKERKRAFQFAIVAPEIFAQLSMDDNAQGCTHADELMQYLPWRILVPCEKEKCINNTCLQVLNEQRRVTCIYDVNFEEYKTNSKLDAEKVLATCWEKWMQWRWGGNFKLNFYFDNDNQLEKKYTFTNSGNNALNDIFIPVILNTTSTLPSTLPELNEKRFIFYDRHGALGIKLYAKELYNFRHDDFFKKHSWIHIDKNNPDFDIIYSWKSGNLEKILSFMAQLAESGLHRILLVDERAAQIAYKDALHASQWGNELKRDTKYLWEAAAGQVFIADSLKIGDEEVFGNLNITNPIISIEFNNSNVTIKSGILGDIPFDTLIIHRTMFDKLFNNKNITQWWNKLNEMFPNILINTGAGILEYDPNVMKRIRKISYSSTLKLLLNGNLAKNYLTKYL